MTIEDYLKTLAEAPQDISARRALAAVATRKVGDEYLRLSLNERPDFSAIAHAILEEDGARLTPQKRASLVAIVRSIVEAVVDDDEATGITELLKDWIKTGKPDEKRLYEALVVVIGKRLRWVLNKPQFDTLRPTVSPGELMNDLYVRLHQTHLPESIEDRYAFFRYLETVLKNLLRDLNRAKLRKKRGDGEPESLDDLIAVLEDNARGTIYRPNREQWLDLEGTIEQLPEQVREAIRMRYLWGWDGKEMEAKLQVSKATVGRLLAQGLTSLKEILSKGGYSTSGERP